MNVPKPVEFPEVTNAAINISLTADTLNQVIKFLQEKYPNENKVVVENAYAHIGTGVLREGVRATKNGKYYIPGKGFIKKEEAFL